MDITLNLLVHIITGTIAIAAGITALFAKKGARLHRLSGKTFFVSMMIMASSGAIIAWFKPMMISVIAGVFTCYLVTTSLMAVKTPAGIKTKYDYYSAAVSFLIFIAGVFYGFEAMNAESGLKDGFSAEPYFFFAGLALISFGLDIKLLVQAGVKGKHRIARHLWRMCFALNIAVGSLLTQGGRALPQWMVESPLMAVAEDAILFIMLFWLIRLLVWNKIIEQLKRLKMTITKLISSN